MTTANQTVDAETPASVTVSTPTKPRSKFDPRNRKQPPPPSPTGINKHIPLSRYVWALQKSGGLATHAAKLLNVDPSTITAARKRWPLLEQVIADCRSGHIDTAESSLQKACKRGESWAVQFALRCLGKPRGYVEHTSVEHTGIPPPTQVTFIEQRQPSSTGET